MRSDPQRRGFAARQARSAAMSPDEARRAWAELLARAIGMAAFAQTAEAAGRRVDKVEGAPFAGAVIRLRAPFPLRHASAQAAADAFLILAKASVTSGHPGWLAALMGEAARALSALLADETKAAFDRSCRAVGGAD